MILFTADWHVKRDDIIWARRPEIKGDTSNALSKLRKYIIDNSKEITAIFLAGDIFDIPVQSSWGTKVVSEFCDLCADLKIPIYFVEGQHDLSKPPWLSTIHKWPIWIHDTVVALKEYDINVYGHNFTRNKFDLINKIPENVQWLVTHMPFTDFKSSGKYFVSDKSNTKTSKSLCSVTELQSHISAVITGDWHIDYTITNQSGKTGYTELYSIGALIPQTLKEFKDTMPGFLVFDGDFRKINIPHRSLISVSSRYGGSIDSVPFCVSVFSYKLHTLDRLQYMRRKTFTDSLIRLVKAHSIETDDGKTLLPIMELSLTRDQFMSVKDKLMAEMQNNAHLFVKINDVTDPNDIIIPSSRYELLCEIVDDLKVSDDAKSKIISLLGSDLEDKAAIRKKISAIYEEFLNETKKADVGRFLPAQ